MEKNKVLGYTAITFLILGILTPLTFVLYKYSSNQILFGDVGLITSILFLIAFVSSFIVLYSSEKEWPLSAVKFTLISSILLIPIGMVITFGYLVSIIISRNQATFTELLGQIGFSGFLGFLVAIIFIVFTVYKVKKFNYGETSKWLKIFLIIVYLIFLCLIYLAFTNIIPPPGSF